VKAGIYESQEKRRNTMMRRAMSIGAIVLVAGTLAVPVLAQGPLKGRWTGKPGYGPGQCLSYGRDYRGAPLTEEQQARVEELRTSHFDETGPLRNELWAKREQMRGLMASETLDEARVKALQKEINTLRSELADKRAEIMIELRKVDPEARFAGRFGRSGYTRWGRDHGPQGMRQGGGGGYGPGWCRN
jgi:zinc resistance-associated protein